MNTTTTTASFPIRNHLKSLLTWLLFGKYVTGIMGMFFTVAAVGCLLALNWDEMHSFAKTAIPAILLLFSLGGLLYNRRGSAVHSLCLYAIALLIGPLFATIGQGEQDWENAWKLSGLWGATLVPLAAATRSGLVWFAALFLGNASLFLLYQQTPLAMYSSFYGFPLLFYQALLNMFILAALEVFALHNASLHRSWQYRLVSRFLAICLSLGGTCYLLQCITDLGWPIHIPVEKDETPLALLFFLFFTIGSIGIAKKTAISPASASIFLEPIHLPYSGSPRS